MQIHKQHRKKSDMTFHEAIEALEAAGIEDADTEARILFAELGRIPSYKLHTENPCVTDTRLTDAIERRKKREPLAYILGELDFYRERYRVSPDVLIPRCDTEILVENAIRLLPQNAHFYDFCTGSGCIAISVLAARPDCTATAIDISEKAIALARENAERNGVSTRLTLRVADLLKEKIDVSNAAAILSNPPYIADGEKPSLAPELSFEPQNALFAEKNGLQFYRRFLSLYREDIKEGKFFLFEIGYNQKEALLRLAAENDFLAEFFCDYGGNTRVAYCRALASTLLL